MRPLPPRGGGRSASRPPVRPSRTRSPLALCAPLVALWPPLTLDPVRSPLGVRSTRCARPLARHARPDRVTLSTPCPSRGPLWPCAPLPLPLGPCDPLGPSRGPVRPCGGRSCPLPPVRPCGGRLGPVGRVAPVRVPVAPMRPLWPLWGVWGVTLWAWPLWGRLGVGSGWGRVTPSGSSRGGGVTPSGWGSGATPGRETPGQRPVDKGIPPGVSIAKALVRGGEVIHSLGINLWTKGSK